MGNDMQELIFKGYWKEKSAQETFPLALERNQSLLEQMIAWRGEE